MTRGRAAGRTDALLAELLVRARTSPEPLAYVVRDEQLGARVRDAVQGWARVLVEPHAPAGCVLGYPADAVLPFPPPTRPLVLLDDRMPTP